LITQPIETVVRCTFVEALAPTPAFLDTLADPVAVASPEAVAAPEAAPTMSVEETVKDQETIDRGCARGLGKRRAHNTRH
jgi:hypothetical protein